MKYFVHIMEKYLEETATYLDDPNFLKLHRLNRRFSCAALFPGIVRVPRTFRYNSFRIHKTHETSVLNIGLSCSVQAAGRLLPKKTMAATEHSGHWWHLEISQRVEGGHGWWKYIIKQTCMMYVFIYTWLPSSHLARLFVFHARFELKCSLSCLLNGFFVGVCRKPVLGWRHVLLKKKPGHLEHRIGP